MSNQQPNNRSLTGFVTKLVGDGTPYGFVNDEIFFAQTKVTGGPAAVGDQVFVECEYSANLPIKWNATSVKVLNKAAGQHQTNQSGQQQQDIINQQQFNQTPSVAITYQQHRQQRQQRQMSGKPEEDNRQQAQPNLEQQPTRLLETANNQRDFFPNANNMQNFPQQQSSGSNIQPFQEQPMGPPNFTYTSQLGSAFVQNQFVPSPFLAQQPPPMLPPQQQHQVQQHLASNNQMHNQNNQSRHNNNLHNKGMGGRYNNDNKNDRQNNRRNMNRNDNNNKFDRPRSNDRDGSSNNRQSKNNSRDRSIGRKTDDLPVRPSPPPHSSARSTTSVSSDKGSKGRRHYDIQNIPKTQIMSNINAYNMKQRCPSFVHVPSDLKNVIVNSHFRFDLKNTPKPINFIIEPNKNIQGEDKTEEAKAIEVKEANNEDEQPKKEMESSNQDDSEITESKIEQKVETKLEHPTPPSSKSDQRLNHKYGVKVLLISFPELENFYRSVFGNDLDSFNTDSKSVHNGLDEVISLLCNKGTNSGHSLVGGKFDPILDGYVEGETNQFERHGRKPDLIATCKRVVMEQLDLDLSQCRSWTLLSTFMYNNKTDYFSSKASIEYSFIYIPQLWTMLTSVFDKNVSNREVLEESREVETSTDVKKLAEVEMVPEVETAPEIKSSETLDMEPKEQSVSQSDEVEMSGMQDREMNESIHETSSSINSENLAELKVADLKSELDKRNIKYKGSAKKADLIMLLQESIQPEREAPSTSVPPTESEKLTEVPENEERQLEEGEVLPGPSETNSPDSVEETELVNESENKRKASESDTAEDTSSKKLCTENIAPAREQNVELIKQSFKVHAKGEHQLSLVSLHEATQAGRYDQFELTVSSNILKESLIQHFSEYIMTTLVEDYRQKQSSNINTSQNSSSQETNSDTNNNSTKNSFKNPSSSSSNTDNKTNQKEYPVDRYINLAFTFFDASHMGYIYFEDLNKLFNNTGLTISKRALMALLGDAEKFNYRTLPEISPKLPPTYVYEFPLQFNKLPGSISNHPSVDETPVTNIRLVEHKGVVYDVEKLIQQVKDAETLSVSLVDRFNYAINNSDKQAEEIHVLEVNQKSLAKAIKTQNDEICDLKRERESLKKKYDSIRKSIKGTIGSLSDLLKDDKQ